MEPYYERAEDKMGVTGTHGIPRLPGNNNYKVLAAGARKLGYQEFHTGNMAINSQPRHGRGACQQIGFCFQGCKSGAKWSTLYTEIPAGERTGNLEVRSDCMVLRVEHDARGEPRAWSMPTRKATDTSRRRAWCASPATPSRVRVCCSTALRRCSPTAWPTPPGRWGATTCGTDG